MKLVVEDYAGRRRDSHWERELAHSLRSISEPERFEFINELLGRDHALGLELARKCLTSPQYFEAILDRAVRETDASSIRWWLTCVVKRLGFRRTVNRLRERVADCPQGVENARYWLTSFSTEPGYSTDEITTLGRLSGEVASLK